MRYKITNFLKSFNKLYSVQRNYSSKEHKCTSLIYEENGDPLSKLDLVDSVLGTPKKNEVLVKMLASPINPADINMIQGVYPVRPKLPAIGGNEGVGEVMEVGSKVTNLKVGDWVVPALSGWGTWRSHALCEASDLLAVSNQLSPIAAATLAVNPCTAFRMLKDFADLQEGDVVLQNAANSAVGQAVIQIAKHLNLRTVNVVRKRDSIKELTAELEGFGATHVVTDEFARSPDMKELFSKLPKAKLVLNAVGGKAVMELVKHLEADSCLVTYGGMSRQPLMLSTGSFIFNNFHAHGFWMTRWNEENRGSEAQADMLEWLTAMLLEGKLQPPKHETRPLHEYREAFTVAMQPYAGSKQLLTFPGHPSEC